MSTGFLSILLHAHLPYVRHPEHERFAEENWLFEAITECYLPLLAVFERLHRDGVRFRLGVSLSPTLITMLADGLLRQRYLDHLHRLLALADKEVRRTCGDPGRQRLARWYRGFYLRTLRRYQQHHQGDLLAAFRRHHQLGHLQLLTTAASHGLLPLLSGSQAAVRNQIHVGLATFNQHLGFMPTGFWLPECGYYPGLERHLAAAGIDHFFLDSHGLLDATPPPRHGVYAPLDCGNGVLAFARDPASSRQVWSANDGYPGDPDYREYHNDIGFDPGLDLAYLGPHLPDGQTRANTGIKYHRVTGGAQAKQLYQPARALAKARLHAADFIAKRQQQLGQLAATMDRPPIIVAPYDAELFGHWWLEGPYWLEQVLRLADRPDSQVRTQTCADYLRQTGGHQTATPAPSTWGEGGYYGYWLNASNDWVYPLLFKAGAEMEKLAADLRGLAVTPLQQRALNQAARSLLLAQASDWPFILKSGTHVDYANKQLTDHLARFNYLHDCIRKNRINERHLAALELMDDIFPGIDFRGYADGGPALADVPKASA